MELSQPTEFANTFIEHFGRKGFGSMNKNDFEVLIFFLLQEYGSLSDLKDNYSVSRVLKIPETKVRRLAYEADLHYRDFKKRDITEHFFEVVNNSTFRLDSNKVEFVIESRFLRSSVSAQLKNLGHYADGSFNSEIVRIHLESFVDLLHYYYGENLVESIVNSCRNLVTHKSSDKSLFHTLMIEFLKGAASQTGKSAIKLAELKLTGGLTNVTDLIEVIKCRFEVRSLKAAASP